MFNRPIIILFSIFFLLILSVSVIKNKSRNLEKEIFKLKSDILILEKYINDAEVEYIYLSSPEILIKNLDRLNKNEYSTQKPYRIFYSTDQFVQNISKRKEKVEKKAK